MSSKLHFFGDGENRRLTSNWVMSLDMPEAYPAAAIDISLRRKIIRVEFARYRGAISFERSHFTVEDEIELCALLDQFVGKPFDPEFERIFRLMFAPYES